MRYVTRLFLALTILLLIVPSARAATPLVAHAPTTQGMPVCSSLSGLSVVFASYGALYLSSTGGGRSCRLTSSMDAKEPRRSPDGRHVAFLTGVGTGGTGNGGRNSVRILALDGTHWRDATVRTDGLVHGDLTWSPDSRALAFLDGPSLWIWQTQCRCSREAVRGSLQAPVHSFAWSPNSRLLAAYRSPQDRFPIARVPLALFNLHTNEASVVPVYFPTGIGNPRTGTGSYPSRLLGWTSSDHLLIGTSGWGIGVTLTGIWSAPSRGGQARLVVGARSHGYGVSNSLLLNADSALLSPDMNRLLIGLPNRFAVETVAGRFIRWLIPEISGSCQITQFLWGSDAVVAFVSVCTTGTQRLFSRLTTVSISTGVAHRIANAHAHQQDVLSIAPRVRCVGCGAG